MKESKAYPSWLFPSIVCEDTSRDRGPGKSVLKLPIGAGFRGFLAGVFTSMG